MRLAPNAHIYTALMETHLRSGDVHGGSWIGEMQDTESLVSQDIVPHNMYIDALVRGNDLSAAPQYLTAVLMRRLTPDVMTYKSLINGYAIKGDAMQAERAPEEMTKAGLRPDKIVCTAMVSACCRHGNTAGAVKWLKYTIDQSLKLDAVAYTAVVAFFATRGDVNNASAWLGRMLDALVSPTAIS